MASTKNTSLALDRLSSYFLIAAVLVALSLFFWVISDFVSVLIYSVLLSIFFSGMHKMIAKKFGKWKSFSAFLSTLIVFVVIFVPLTVFLIFLIRESIDAYALIDRKLQTFNLYAAVNDLDQWLSFFDLRAWLESLDADELVRTAIENISANVSVVSQAAVIGVSALQIFANTVLAFFVMLLTTFFLFRDGDRFLAYIKRISPLPVKYEQEIEEKLRETTNGIVWGNFGTALLQGFFAALGFLIAGVDNFFLWLTIMSFASLIPYVGASIVWGPVSLFFLFQQAWFPGIFLIVWGLFVVSGVDNLARPFLIGGRARMHPLPTFLVVMGGILIFNIKGIIFGPLILSLTLTILHIYELEYSERASD